jgi:magnesium chelatase subunit H
VKLYEYLQVLENRLFSSGLHTLGEAPNQEELTGYLDAYFGNEPQRHREHREIRV